MILHPWAELAFHWRRSALRRWWRRFVYHSYLRSPKWQIKRLEALKRARWQCEEPGCRETQGLQVHHLTYAHIFNELPEELKVLCDDHHRAAHRLPPKRIHR